MRYALAAVLLLLTLPAAAQSDGDPLRIMLIGDSITEGDHGGYRAPLFVMLSDAFGMPNFVGHRNGRRNDPGLLPDHDHEGYGAYRIDQITTGEGFWSAPPIEERLAAWDPAVVTLHVGTNDMQQGYYLQGDPGLGIPDVMERLEDLVSRIVAFNPEIYVVVAQIVPANPPANPVVDLRIQAFNARIPDLVAAHRAQGHRVSLVDLYTPLLAYPHPDGIHPSLEGYRVMAEELFDALRAIGVVPRNANQGRDDGLLQFNDYSPSVTPSWTLTPNLLRSDSPTLARAVHHGYGGLLSPDALTDGNGNRAAHDEDNRWTSTYVFDTSEHPAGFDVTEIRTYAGGRLQANGDERAHQAYEVWWSSVDAPTSFVRLGDFHHIIVNDDERASRIALTREGGPLASGVQALQFRFVEPPRRQTGFIGLGSPSYYREVEALGAPTVPGGSIVQSAITGYEVALSPAAPNPFSGRTTLQVALPEAGPVHLAVYDALGRRIAVLLDGALPAGLHDVPFDASALPAGPYHMRLHAGGRTLTQTITHAH